MKLKSKKLLKLRCKIIKDHKISWFFFVLSIVLAIWSSLKMAYYNEYPYCSSMLAYAVFLILSTLSIGYFSAFLFYILHDFIPQSKKRLKDIQRAITLELGVYDCVETLEAHLFKGAQMDSSNYCRTFIKLTTEIVIEGGIRRIKFTVPAEKYLRMLSYYIEHCKSLLPFLDNADIPVELYNSLSNLDLYEMAQKRNSVDAINNNSFDEEILKTYILQFIESRDNLKNHIDYLERYSYIIIKKWVPYD